MVGSARDDVSWAATCHGDTRQTGVTTFLYDLQHAARALRKHPGFLAVVVLTLGFGIGINTATFSIVNAVLLRPLPFDQPGAWWRSQSGLGPGRKRAFSPPDFIDVQREQQSFDGIAAYAPRAAELSGNGAPVRLDVTRVSWNLFEVLGSARCWDARSRTGGRPGVDVAVLSYGLWQTRSGADRSIIGRTVALDRRPYTVVGVMPPAFSFPLRGRGFNATPAAAWVPMAFADRQLQVQATSSFTASSDG